MNLVILLWLLVGPDTVSSPELRAAPPQLQAKGIYGYTIKTLNSSDVDLDLVDASSAKVMSLEFAINEDRDELRIRHIQVGRSDFVINWRQSDAFLTLTSDGDILHLWFDIGTWTWKRAGAEHLYGRALEAIQLSGPVFTDLVARKVVPGLSPEPVRDAKLSAMNAQQAPERELSVSTDTVEHGFVEAQLESWCAGDWIRSDFMFAAAASLACIAATDDVNLKCWNRYCTGCCEYSDCDNLCGLGDYFCSGVINGRSCTKYPPPPQIECMDTPIIIDLEGGAYRLTSPAEGVLFDIDGDGIEERVSWTAGSTGFLALDRNGNGVIDNGQELFGSATVLADGTKASNGFVALSESDMNGDGSITPHDMLWSRLLFWLDKNHNGTSEPSELTPLSSTGVRSLSLDYRTVGRKDQFGNVLRFTSLATIGQTTRPIYDVFLLREITD